MIYLLNESQKEIALHCMLNKSSKKYMLNGIVEIPDTTDLDKLQNSILDVLNYNPLLKAVFYIDKGKFFLKEREDYSEKDIKRMVKSNIDSIEHDPIFEKDFDILNEESLIRVCFAEVEKKKYILISVHHLIFDVFSSIVFFEEIFKLYNDDITVNELDYRIKKNFPEKLDIDKSKLKSKKAYEYYANHAQTLKNFHKESSSLVFTEEADSKKIQINDKTFLLKNTRKQSAIIILALAKTIRQQFNMNNVVVGVPVPNRNKENRDLISCLVNVLPVFIRFNTEKTEQDLIQDIEVQLFKNLRYQAFKFSTYFRKEMGQGEFPVIFTYYPTDFKFKSDKFYLNVKKLFFPESPAKVYVMAKESGEIYIETKSNKKNIIMDIEENINSLIERGFYNER
ncbi:condensation domain-containing protein [Bacillus mojavensis]|uniref:condensation domain-containing protein n=1 Tax=Bacillus mojavensis TaxID=72360 RepID=UPI002DBBD88B|nr:condensation domain-containing protein [Bacillus mojavensis]MEC1685488.1 condensation domain-containing protein [Bacillus mojavensis]MEC1708281.1 condensation domain-containing protein [Bacillus mojavensis]